MSITQTLPVAQSPYLVQRLLARTQETLFDYVKFRMLKQVLPAPQARPLRIADFGCGPQVAARRLGALGLTFEYCGVDYEAQFRPQVVGDLRDPKPLAERLPWQPDVITLLDVLEHLDGQQADIRAVLRCCHALLAGNQGQLVITVPQLYRLDALKLPHLHYPEHKIRLTQAEWRALIEEHFHVEAVHAVGFLSVIPYLPMLSRRFRPDNRLGRLFTHLRETTMEKGWIRRLDWLLSRHAPGFTKRWSNDVLFVARPR